MLQYNTVHLLVLLSYIKLIIGLSCDVANKLDFQQAFVNNTDQAIRTSLNDTRLIVAMQSVACQYQLASTSTNLNLLTRHSLNQQYY